MKKKRNLKPAVSPADEPATPAQVRFFASFLLPLFEEEWQRELNCSRPCWMYLAVLHRHIRELEEQTL